MPGLKIARVDRKKTASNARSTKRKLDFKGSLIVGGGALTAALLLQSSLERRSENAGERGRGSTSCKPPCFRPCTTYILLLLKKKNKKNK